MNQYIQANGRGKQLFKDGPLHKGYWKNNLAHGKGRLVWSDGSRYEGQFKNDKSDGYGTYTSKSLKYTGEWVEDE